jgi:hypothetical protein
MKRAHQATTILATRSRVPQVADKQENSPKFAPNRKDTPRAESRFAHKRELFVRYHGVE